MREIPELEASNGMRNARDASGTTGLILNTLHKIFIGRFLG